jgi:hypothetical protein
MKNWKIWRGVGALCALALCALAVCAVCALAACAVPLGEDYVEVKENVLVIGDYDLSGYVPAPVAGAVVWVSSRGDMDVEVVWKADDTAVNITTFEGETVYQADITLRAKNNWTFDPEIAFQYIRDAVTEQPESNLDPSLRKLSTVTYKQTGGG